MSGQNGGSSEGEVGDGHDGTWVAHPVLVPIARELFDRGSKPDAR